MKLIDELYDTIRFVNETPNAVFDMDKIEDIFAAIEDKLQFYEILEQALDKCYVIYEGMICEGKAIILSKEELGIKIQLNDYSWASKICKIKDYKKTWSLKREELEHEIKSK